MSEWDQTGAEAPERPTPKTPGWDEGVPPDPAWGEQTLRGLVAGQVVFGRYRLERVLGQGGMGVVWLARDEELGEEVALKFLPQELVHDAVALDELRDETRKSRRLTHPNIVRVHDFHHDAPTGMAALSMEYVDGATLSAMRLRQPNKVFEAQSIEGYVGQLCQALDYAHGRGIIHRDLKPANLMVDVAGDLKVCDFGIACSIRDSVTRVTGRQSTSGTLVYMSPQQLDGEMPSPADDIYSLGATIYELFTGKPPFLSGDIVGQIRAKVPAAMSERRVELGVPGETIPPYWESLVEACLAKGVEQRPRNSGEVAEGVRGFAHAGQQDQGMKSDRIMDGASAEAVPTGQSSEVQSGLAEEDLRPPLPLAGISVLDVERRAEYEQSEQRVRVGRFVVLGIAIVAMSFAGGFVIKSMSAKGVGGSTNLRAESDPLPLTSSGPEMGQMQFAETAFRASLNEIDRALGSDDDQISPADGTVADIAESTTDSSDAREKVKVTDSVPVDMTPKAKQARLFFDKGNYDAAAEKYCQILARYPDNLYALSNLGVTYFQQGKFENAEEVLRRAIQVAPNDGFSHAILGIVYYMTARFDEAVSTLTRASTLDPSDPQTHNYLGIACSRKGWQQVAEQEVRKAIEINPSYGDAHWNLAVIYATKSPPAKELARRHYKRALELGLDPKSDPALGELLK